MPAYDPNKLQRDVADLKTFKESLFGPGSTDDLAAQERQYQAGLKMNGNVPPVARPIPGTSWFLEDREKNPENIFVYNPIREDNLVVPLRSSALCFYKIARAIEGAKESVDIITMGIDTDMRLIHDDLKQKNRILNYKRAYPAEPSDTSEGIPDKYSYVISDLLTRVSREDHIDPETNEPRGPIAVRMIAGTPRTIGGSFFDPLHFWYRCKRFKGTENDPYKNIKFALREGKGVYIKPPSHPEADISGMSFGEILKAFGVLGLDALARALMHIPGFYQWVFTNHQKIYAIDIGTKDAHAFIIGSNMSEQYWDEPSSLLYNPLRMPYGPWRDAGLWVKGPVLYDIAKNIEQSWQVMIDSKAEVLPDELVADGIRAERSGMLREEEGLFAQPGTPKTDVDFSLFQRILEFAPFMAMLLKPGNLDPLKLLGICGALATVIDMAGGLLNGTLLFNTSVIKKETEWGVEGESISLEKYKLPAPQSDDEQSIRHIVQFDRTFSQEKMDDGQDFSIVHGLYRAVTKVNPGDLIYIENQYFRDTQLVQLFKFLAGSFPDDWIRAGSPSGGINPYVIIVTSDPSTTSEGILSSGPTFSTYKMLEKAGVDFHFCRLRTKEHGPLLDKDKNKIKFLGPRCEEGVGEKLLMSALDKLKFLMALSPLALALVHNRFRNFRDILWAAVPALLYGARQGLGPTSGTVKPSMKDLEPVLGELDKVATLLVNLEKEDNELKMLAEQLGQNPDQQDVLLPQIIKLLGGQGGEPPKKSTPDDIAKDGAARDKILEELKKTCPQTPAHIPVPEIKDDPGSIYVHTKAIIINSIFAMLGSANNNERSMWHDTEDMLAVRGKTQEDFPGQLQKELFENVLSGDIPMDMAGEIVFEEFSEHLLISAFFTKHFLETLVCHET